MGSLDERLLSDAVAYIDDWLQYRQRTLRLPGIQAAVGYDGRVLLSAAHGMADLERGEPLTTEHVFRIASHSKTFTATAVMQLVEQGRLRLDDRVGQHLTWLPDGPDQIGRVAVRELLSHSAGVVRDGDDGGFWQLERDFPDATEFRERIGRLDLVVPATTRFKYSNFGFTLLGMLVEAVADQPYNAYVTQHIVQALGLPRTGPELDDRARAWLATGYTSGHYGMERLPLDHIDTRAMSAATGFWSTAEDLCRYATAHFLGSRELLSDASRREMQREHWAVGGTDQHYGLGFGIYRIGERRLIGHGGGFPGFITATRLDPEARLVVVALTNASGSPAAEIASGMVRIIDRALASRPAGDPGSLVNGDRFTGRFWALGGALDIVRFGADLLVLEPEAANPVEEVLEVALDGESGDRLRIAEAPGYRSPGEPIQYDFGPDGRPRRVQLGAISFYPWQEYEDTILPTVRETRRAPQRPPLTP